MTERPIAIVRNGLLYLDKGGEYIRSSPEECRMHAAIFRASARDRTFQQTKDYDLRLASEITEALSQYESQREKAG